MIALGSGAPAAVTAAPTTPPSSPAVAGYPELRVAVSDAGFSFPAQIPAGRTLVTVDNPRPQGITITFVRPPAGHSAAETQAALAAPDPVAWLYDATFVGGPYARAGASARGIVDLTPGDWFVWGGQSLDVAPPVLTATARSGATPEAVSEPAMSATVELREFAFAGLERGAPAAPRLWAFTNTGDQPRLMDLVKAPGPITEAQVIELLSLPDGATPAGLPSPDEFECVAGLGTLSSGQTAWLVLPTSPPAPTSRSASCPTERRGCPTP